MKLKPQRVVTDCKSAPSGFLEEGLDLTKGMGSNNKIMFITNAEIHIYMPKANITPELKATWMNKLDDVNPKIKFEIKALEDFVK